MSEPGKDSPAARFKWLIDQTMQLDREVREDAGLGAGRAILANWQCARLAESYADFHAEKRFRPALDFFLTDIYGPKDFSQRDSDILRVYPLMVKMLTPTAIDSLAMAIELHALSMRLDKQLLHALVDDLGMDPADGDAALTPQLYAEAYRLCDNREQREHQIELAVGAAELLESAVQHKMLYLTVKIARQPAKLAGFGELQSFIERGFSAFRKMKGAPPFIAALKQREEFVLEQIYAQAPVKTWLGKAAHAIAPPP